MSEWIEWEGGDCPVKRGVKIEIKTRCGTFWTANSEKISWEWENEISDVIAFRILEKVITQDQLVANVSADLGKEVIQIPNESSPDTNVALDTNPKKQYGVQSVPLNMWSPLASAYGSLGLYNGSLKYGTANFANTPVEASIYIAGAMRHLAAWASGEEFDPADGVPNLGGVLANVAILLEARAAGTLIDDRANMSGYLKEREKLREVVANLNKIHAGKNPKHYYLNKEE